MNDNREIDFWETPKGTAFALGFAVVVSLVMLFGNLSGLGIWEPWEANEISVAQEYMTRGEAPETVDPEAASWNWAVPTHNRRPVDRPLLKTMLVGRNVGGNSVDTTRVGSLERAARIPIAAATLLMVMVFCLWLYRRFGTLGAAISTIALVSSPAIYLGAHNLASEMLFVATSTLAIVAFAELSLGRSQRVLWALAYGGALALGVLDQRLIGLFLPLLVLGGFAATETLLGEVLRRRDGPSAPAKFGVVELVGAAVAGFGVIATAMWARAQRPTPDEAIPGFVLQIATISAATCVIAGLFWFGRKSRPGRAFFHPLGLLGTSIGVVAAIALARAYTAANPILLEHGDLFGRVRVFGFMLSNHMFATGANAEHLTFDVAIRQVGFSLFPWVALVPLGFAYVCDAAATRNPDGTVRGTSLFSPQYAIRRLLLVWMVVTAIVLTAASAWSHYFYPAYAPIAASIGLAMTDAEFYKRARQHPLAGYALGFVGITIILMLGKDLERFPIRFVETYLTLQEKVELPDDFMWGRSYKPLKYVVCAALAVHFFGLATWAAITLRRIRNLREPLLAIKERRWGDVFGPPPHEAPFLIRMREKEALRQGEGAPARLFRALESARGYAPVLAVLFTIVAGLFLFRYIPGVTYHLSQRGVFEAYTRMADPGEPLLRYQVSSRDNSVYLTDVETVRGAEQFAELFESEERMFAIVPRTKLASIDYDIRQRFKKNLHVLDARSSRLLLVSNKLEEGEEDHSFVSDKIVTGEPKIDYPYLVEVGGEKVHATFDKKLEFLGYSLDHEPEADGYVAYRWGEKMTITYFFRVLKRVPSSQKIFLHVDYPGTRINGDHVPNDGDFPTNYWMEGDIVKDVQKLEIESYSTPGIYTLNMGFFLGSRRMSVDPRAAHDGHDRITIGQIRVNGL